MTNPIACQVNKSYSKACVASAFLTLMAVLHAYTPTEGISKPATPWKLNHEVILSPHGTGTISTHMSGVCARECVWSSTRSV